MGELFVVLGCGLFFLITSIISYIRFNADFKEVTKKRKEVK